MGHQKRHAKHFKATNAPHHCFVRDEEGVSAIEFALLAPMLILSLLAMVDVGMALSERMTIDHILRAGAQVAVNNLGSPEIDHVMRTTAANNMTVLTEGETGSDTSLFLNQRRIFICAAQPTIEFDNDTTCADETPTQIFYKLSGHKTYAGIILPQFELSKDLLVQIR